MNSPRDIEQLSAYLDGQLTPSDSARLESRLKTDRELASAYEDIRSARGILRKLPMRKAPRNFILTRKMVGLKPPLPRAYPTFRFATTFATILFAITITVNSIAPRITFGFGAAAPAPAFGMGGGCGDEAGCGGGAPDTQLFADSAPAATEAPAAVQAPMEAGAATEAPAATELPQAELSVPAATAVPTNERIAEETAMPKDAATESESVEQAKVTEEAPVIPVAWQITLFAIVLFGVLTLFVMNQSAKRKWQ